jgi:hypothetical protein
MPRRRLSYCVAPVVLVAAAFASQPPASDPAKLEQPQAHARPLDTAAIERITGLKGAMNSKEGAFKINKPRQDVPVQIDGRRLEPFMGLTSWAAFQPDPAAGAMVMGDLVLFEDEVNPVMSAALGSGLSITALHNHFFFDTPKVFFMHIGGEGNEDQLATAVRAAFDASDAVRRAHKEPQGTFGGTDVPAENSIVGAPLEEALGVKGESKDGMFKAVIGRTVAMPCGCSGGATMGVNTWAAFAGSPDRALVDGDFVAFEGELQPVLKSLRAGGINIVAIHNHMEGETPRAIFLHYWGKGKAVDLARAVKGALDAQAAVKPAEPHHAH